MNYASGIFSLKWYDAMHYYNLHTCAFLLLRISYLMKRVKKIPTSTQFGLLIYLESRWLLQLFNILQFSWLLYIAAQKPSLIYYCDLHIKKYIASNLRIFAPIIF